MNFKYVLKDTFNFFNKVRKIIFEKEHFIISIDFESLFTNISVDETIEITKNAFFNYFNLNIN